MAKSLVRIVTSAGSLVLVSGQLRYVAENGYDCFAVSGGPEENSREFTEREGDTYWSYPSSCTTDQHRE